jgi:hypothetical protein
MCNRYRVDLNHPDSRGIDCEVYADDEAEALATALAASPEGAYAERVVPMEIDVEPPLPPEPPITRAEGEDDAAYAARVGAAHAAWQETQKQAVRERQAAREAAVVRNEGESDADYQSRRQAARDGARNVPAADMPPLPVPEWPELTEAEAAVWEARKAAEEARLAATVPALEHAPVEAHDPTRAEARAAARAERAEAKADRDDARRR